MIEGVDFCVIINNFTTKQQYLFLYTKNRPEAGGSAYIQAKVMNAKDMLVE